MSIIPTRGFSMLRKIASLSVALIVAGGVMVAVPAQAAPKISNGVACTSLVLQPRQAVAHISVQRTPL